MADFEAIFKAYDIRGIVGEQIDAAACGAIGGAFANYVKAEGSSEIVLGRDMRPDSVELSEAFTSGVTDAGIDVTDIGLCSTETLYFASGLLGAPGAMFTASHNPVGYNGIKLCGTRATPISADDALKEIKAMAQTPSQTTAPVAGTVTERDLLEEYIAHVLSFVDVSTLRPLKVVVDAANGMAGMIVPAVFKALPFELDLLYPELDGTFPNHPADPLQPENLRDLQDQVRATSADIGLAFDGDADRVFVIDETAQPVSGSLTTALVAQEMLIREPESVIIHNLICSACVPEIITKLGGKAVRCRVGHSFMKQMMATTGAVFGGEHSGHYYFRDNYGADSAMVTALVVLEALSKHNSSLSSLITPMRRYSASGEINFKVSDMNVAIDRVATAFSTEKQDRLDGLTVHCTDWWFNLRPSNTEHLLRLNLEALTPAVVTTKVNEIKRLLT